MSRIKQFVAVAIVVGISFFACSKLFSPFFYTSQDGPGHLIRMIEFHDAVSDGQMPVRIAQHINYGLGYPFFEFNYPLPYYLGEGLQRLGLSTLNAFKTLLVGATLLSGVSFFFWLLPYAGTLAALVGSTFWVIAPYKFLNMYVRGNVAEYLGLAMVSLGLLVVDRFLRKQLNGYVVTLYFALFLLSHNITAVIGIPFLFLYGLWVNSEIKLDKRRIWHIVVFFISALGVTAFFWGPAMIEAPLTKLSELRSDYISYFPSLRDIIYSPWGFGSFARGAIPGKMSVQLGLVHTLVVLLALVILIASAVRRKLSRPFDRLAIFFGTLVPFLMFITLPVSKPVWETVPFLQFVQIPWRFMGYLTLSASVLAAYILWRIPGKAKWASACLLFFLLMYANRNHIRVNQYIPYENPFVADAVMGPSTTSKDEHMPLWAPHIYEAPAADGEVFPTAAGVSKRTLWKSNNHMFVVAMSRDGEFRDNTSYFPGWVATVDGEAVSIRYRDDPFGRLRVSLPGGIHEVQFTFGEPGYRKVADGVTVLATLLFVIFWFRSIWLRRPMSIAILTSSKKRVDPGHHRGSARKKGRKKAQ